MTQTSPGSNLTANSPCRGFEPFVLHRQRRKLLQQVFHLFATPKFSVSRPAWRRPVAVLLLWRHQGQQQLHLEARNEKLDSSHPFLLRRHVAAMEAMILRSSSKTHQNIQIDQRQNSAHQWTCTSLKLHSVHKQNKPRMEQAGAKPCLFQRKCDLEKGARLGLPPQSRPRSLRPRSKVIARRAKWAKDQDLGLRKALGWGPGTQYHFNPGS